MPNVDLLGDFADRMYRAHGLESPAPRTARARLKVWWDVGGVKNGWVLMGFPAGFIEKIDEILGFYGIS